ncbi:protein kinase [Nonomuraea phyllanthi]|uniref:Protein kinase n=1 Tax=Nonomuraea phyllanthi TaxID=2219224 RepID=A0A5C4W002_9ACTN|nr:protein kinase [Nonomuraea phyllanthi]
MQQSHQVRPGGGAWAAAVVWACLPLFTCGLATPFTIGFAAFWLRSIWHVVAASVYMVCIGSFVIAALAYNDFEDVPQPLAALVSLGLLVSWGGGVIHSGILVPTMARARLRPSLGGPPHMNPHRRTTVPTYQRHPQERAPYQRHPGDPAAHQQGPYPPRHDEPRRRASGEQGTPHQRRPGEAERSGRRHSSEPDGVGRRPGEPGGVSGAAGAGAAGRRSGETDWTGRRAGETDWSGRRPGEPGGAGRRSGETEWSERRSGEPGGAGRRSGETEWSGRRHGGEPDGVGRRPGEPGEGGRRPGEPEWIGHYRVLKSLGRGGQGAVYLAVTPEGGRVAVKVLHDLVNETARTRFAREVDAARRVATFSTARVLDVNISGQHAYIVSEYVDGPSLEQLVKKHGPRDDDSLTRLALSTAGALAAIHKAGIVHRDFKPSNVLIGNDGPRVIDFGIARALDQVTMVTAGKMVGTPPYMSPEQLTGETVGPASDVFSWAVTIMFAATGRPAFGEDTVPAVFNRVLTFHPDLSPLPAALRGVVGACLSKRPEERPSASDAMVAIVH